MFVVPPSGGMSSFNSYRLKAELQTLFHRFRASPQRHVKLLRKGRGKLAVCLIFPKVRIERVKANCQFALPSRRDFHYFRALHRDMKAPGKI
jgi:hypothetical protein